MKTNRELFKETYLNQLKESHIKNPEQYAWAFDGLEMVAIRMFAAIDKGSFNKDSIAFKNTCKALKIKHTYRDIETFLGSQGATQ